MEDGESLLGYLVRLSALNHFKHAGWFIDHYVQRTASQLLIRGDDLEELGRVTGIGLRRLKKMASHLVGSRKGQKPAMFHGCKIQSRFLSLQRPKICPLCIGDRPVVLTCWDLALWSVCPVHEVFLVSRCPSCADALSWLRPSPDRCRCGTLLTTARAERVADHMQQYALALAAAFSSAIPDQRQYAMLPRSKFNDLVGHLSLRELMQFTVLIGAGPAGRPRDRGWLFLDDRRSGEMPTLIGRAAKVLADWPRGFHSFIESSRGQVRGSPLGQFNSVLNYLRHIIPSPAFDFARAEFERYLRIKWNADLSRSVHIRYTALANGASKYVFAEQAARRLNMSSNSIRAWVLSGRIPGHLVLRKRSLMYVVESQWVDSQIRRKRGHERSESMSGESVAFRPILPARLPEFLTADPAALLLGVNPRRLGKLAATGLIEKSQNGPTFSRSSVESLLGQVAKRARDQKPQRGTSKLVSIVANASRYEPLTLERIIELILQRRLPVTVIAREDLVGLRQFAVPHDLLRRLQRHEQSHKAAAISRSAAAQILGCGLKQIAGLLEAKILSERGSDGVRRNRSEWMWRAEVQEFAKRYVLVGTLKRRLAVDSHGLPRHLAALGIAPVFDHLRPGIPLFWKRDEVEAKWQALATRLNEVGLVVAQ